MYKNHKTFEDIKAWQLGREFRKKIYSVSKKFPEEEKYVLTERIRHAIISITASIAEGCNRYSFRKNIQFCKTSQDSVNKVLDYLYTAFDEKYVTKEEFNELYQEGRKLEKAIKKLIEDIKETKSLIKGSGLVSGNFEKWKQRRKFIAQAINRDGTILDIGCANGYLLKCLQEWSSHKLIPYGIDINRGLIKQAKELFPSQADNFTVMRVHHLSHLPECGLPAKFDFIYWSIWDRGSWNFEDQRNVNALKTALKTVSDGGRLIFGFYESDKEKITKIKRLKELGFKFSGVLENRGGEEIIIWIDKL